MSILDDPEERHRREKYNIRMKWWAFTVGLVTLILSVGIGYGKSSAAIGLACCIVTILICEKLRKHLQ